MLKRIAILSAAAATAAVFSLPVMASNGGVVGNVVNAGENIVNDVVGAGENVVDDIADAVTGRNDGMRSDGINRSAAENGTAAGTTGTTEGGAATAPDEVPDSTDKNDSATQNPSTGISFAYGTLAALALGGAGMMMTFRRDD